MRALAVLPELEEIADDQRAFATPAMASASGTIERRHFLKPREFPAFLQSHSPAAMPEGISFGACPIG
jgi:hypothetical protein